MYPVSAEYISAMNGAIQRHKIFGKISDQFFYGEDILKGSMTLSDQCSDSTDLTLGGVFVGTLKFTLLNDFGFARGSWKGRVITLNFSQLISEAEDEWETIPVGVYTISEVNHSERGIEVTAYSSMAKLDIPYPSTSTNGTVYDILNLICTSCGVELANTEEEVEAMPNGDAILGIYPENGCSTWRDVAHYAAQIVGGFLTSDRDGKIVLRRFGNDSGFEIDTTKRLTGSKFSDFTTNYTAVTVENMAERTLRTRRILPDNGLTINLGQNPLLQYGTNDTINGMLDNILNEVNSIAYTPFNSSMVGNPAFDLGDLITYTGGTAGVESTCCLMSYTWKFGTSYAVNGFGKNPALANAQSKADKAIGGISSQSKSDIMTLVTYLNADHLNVGSSEVKIVNLHAANTRETMVEFWIELKMNVTVSDSSAVLQFRYALDEVDELYKPVMTFNHSGTYTYSLHYYWKLEQVIQHSFDVFLKVDGGTVDVEVADLHALLKGQGLEGKADWDGSIDVMDTFGLALGGSIGVPFVDHIPSIDIQTPQSITINETFGLSLGGNLTPAFTDVIESPVIRTGVYEIVTEDGFNLVTEDGKPLINDGGEG